MIALVLADVIILSWELDFHMSDFFHTFASRNILYLC